MIIVYISDDDPFDLEREKTGKLVLNNELPKCA